jgi:hypothetical protein
VLDIDVQRRTLFNPESVASTVAEPLSHHALSVSKRPRIQLEGNKSILANKKNFVDCDHVRDLAVLGMYIEGSTDTIGLAQTRMSLLGLNHVI